MFIFTFHEFRIYSLETILQVTKVITFSSFDVASDSGNLKITNLDRLFFTKNGEFTI